MLLLCAARVPELYTINASPVLVKPCPSVQNTVEVSVCAGEYFLLYYLTSLAQIRIEACDRESSKMADSGKLLKMEVDYSDTVDKSLPEFQEMAKVSVMQLSDRLRFRSN